MIYRKEQLVEQSVFRHFDIICKIPHVSGHEKALSDYILSWAKDLALEVQQDSNCNLYIRKAATPGYEAAPAVMLQAHIDMVGDQTADSHMDFLTDPIQWVIEGENITTGGKTTLGADDGIGVALAMAVLEDESHPHPRIEVAFTSMEEVDFSGADSFDFPFQADNLINLDGSMSNQILCCSSGGMTADVRLPLSLRLFLQKRYAFELL